MIEKLVREYLAKTLNVPVRLQLPETPPDRFVVLEKTGGGGSTVHSATVAVQSYGQSLDEAIRLNEQVKAAMQKLPEQEQVTRVELNTDYNFTDTRLKRYRYQAVFDIYHY